MEDLSVTPLESSSPDTAEHHDSIDGPAPPPVPGNTRAKIQSVSSSVVNASEDGGGDAAVPPEEIFQNTVGLSCKSIAVRNSSEEKKYTWQPPAIELKCCVTTLAVRGEVGVSVAVLMSEKGRGREECRGTKTTSEKVDSKFRLIDDMCISKWIQKGKLGSEQNDYTSIIQNESKNKKN